jgi:hypothetical protein
MAIDVRRSPVIAPAASLLAIVWQVAGQVSTSPPPLAKGFFGPGSRDQSRFFIQFFDLRNRVGPGIA